MSTSAATSNSSRSTPADIVFVPGSWHTPASYEQFTSALKAEGYSVHCPALPSTDSKVWPQTSTYEDDIAAVRALLKTLVITQKKRVSLIMHSYAAMPGSDATEGLLVSDRSPNSGAIVHLIYLSAFVLPVGWGIVDMQEHAGVEPYPESMFAIDEVGRPSIKDPYDFFYHDVPQAEADVLVSKLETLNVAVLIAGKAKLEPWTHMQCMYLVTEDDRAVSRKIQEAMLAEMKKKGAEVVVERMSGGHSPFASKTSELVGVLKKTLDGGDAAVLKR